MSRRGGLLVWGAVCGLAVAGLAAADEATVPRVPSVDAVSGSPLAEAAMRRDFAQVHALLSSGENEVDGWGRDGSPALHWIVRMGELALAQRLVEHGADVNGANRLGLRPLHVAVSSREPQLVSWLLQSGADPDLPDPAGEPPLILAARSGDLNSVDALLAQGAQVDLRDTHYGQTPLMVAVREGHLPVVRRLVEAGAQINAQSFSGEVPRFILPSEIPVGTSQGVGIIRAGWPERGKRNPITGMKTPLLYATRQGDLEATRFLVESGADLEQADANSITPLLNAILNASIVSVNRTGQSDHLRIANLLLDAGAKVDVQDWYGQTPLWAAVEIRNLKLRGTATDNRVDRAAAFDLIARLLQAGADPNARTREFPPTRRFITATGSGGWVDMTGQTPFLRAALAGDLRVMHLLLAYRADPNIATYQGTTPLMVAAGISWGVTETFDEGAAALLAAVQLTHRLGNDINAVNSMGLRAIHGAANRGSNGIVRYLADNGAHLDVSDNEGRTPVVWAEGVLVGARAPVYKAETVALLEDLLAATATRR